MLIALDVVGMVAFAHAGAAAAVRARLSVFGVVVIGCVHALGGGVLRDLFLGTGIPVGMTNCWYVLTCAVTAAGTVLARRSGAGTGWLLRSADAIGLAAFSVTGAARALDAGAPVLAVALIGMINGIGGSIIGDALIGRVPLLLRTQAYALASLFGTTVFAVCHRVADPPDGLWVAVVAGTVIVLLRALTFVCRWERSNAEQPVSLETAGHEAR